MRLEFINQKVKFDFDVREEYPVIWHRNLDGEQINDLSISPVKGSVEITGDVIIDTGDLKITDCLRLAKAIQALDKASHCHRVAEAAGPHS